MKSAEEEEWLSLRADKDSRIPIYRQIYQAIRQRITSGILSRGDMLPSEKELHKMLGVNHLTIRKGLSLLQEDGLISRVRNSGTIVEDSSRWKEKTDACRIGLLVWVTSEGASIGNLTDYTKLLYDEISARILSMNTESATLIYGPGQNSLCDRVDRLELDGVIAFPTHRKANLEALATINIPKLILEMKIRQDGLDNVAIDCFPGAFAGVSELIRLGHRDIAYVGGLMENQISGEKILYTMPQDSLYRFQAYRQAFEEAGLNSTTDRFYEIPFAQEGADKLIRKLSSGNKLPTAIFAFDDEIAVFLMNSIRSCGYSIPEDISILGFGDTTPESKAGVLATVQVDWKGMSDIAVKRIHERIAHGVIGGLTMSVKTSFKTGSSIASLFVRRPNKGSVLQESGGERNSLENGRK